jgi:hypothetical protein
MGGTNGSNKRKELIEGPCPHAVVVAKVDIPTVNESHGCARKRHLTSPWLDYAMPGLASDSRGSSAKFSVSMKLARVESRAAH